MDFEDKYNEQHNDIKDRALGKPSNLIFGKIWDFGPTEGGGSADPKFLSNFSRTNFTMLNGQKCDETHST